MRSSGRTLTNQLELSLSGFFDPAVPVYSNGITLTSTTLPISSFPGTLSYQLHRHGALAGARWNWGTVWRLSVGGELGWAHHSYTALVHYNDGTPSNVTDYRLPLRDVATDSALLSVGGGVEWFITDRLSLAFQPRLQLLIGREPAIALTLPLVFSYSWYL